MKNKQLIWLSSILAVVFAAIIITSCNKTFDEPPVFIDANIPVTTTIKDLKATHNVAGAIDAITGDQVIAGIVVCDDKSGNYYKQIAIQDATGGLLVRMDASNLYTSYPVGRKVYIKLKGLYISDYGGVCQIGVLDNSTPGSPVLGTIPAALFDTYVFKGSVGNTITPKVITVAQLGTALQDPYQSTLIQLDNFEFSKGDTVGTYADPTKIASAVNYTVKSCGGESIVLRSSSFSNFAGIKVAKGNGSLIAIAGAFGATKQLTIRDTSDVKFYGSRCSIFEEDFSSYASSGTAATVIPGWKNIMETGDVPYTMSVFGGNTFPKVSAFSSTVLATGNISSWLISPDITLPAGSTPKFSFSCSRRYPSGTFKLYVSSNFTGINVSTATWTLITTVPAAAAGAAFTPFDVFGPYSFAAYAGQKINFGFRYEAAAGTLPANVGTYEPDDIKISKN